MAVWVSLYGSCTLGAATERIPLATVPSAETVLKQKAWIDEEALWLLGSGQSALSPSAAAVVDALPAGRPVPEPAPSDTTVPVEAPPLTSAPRSGGGAAPRGVSSGFVTEIRPAARWPKVDLRSVVHSRELLLMFASRDVRLRYRQTVLGALWVVLTPALSAGVFSFVFSVVAKVPHPPGVPYFLLAFTGMIGWTAFSNGVSRISVGFINNSQLITKIYFERLVLALGIMVGTCVDLVVVLVIAAVTMAVYRVTPPLAVLLLPIWLVGLLLLSCGLGLMAGSLMVRYRDLNPVVTIGTQLLLYLSPVAYSVSAVPHKLRIVYDVNPIAGFLQGLRWSLLDTASPAVGQAAYDVLAAAVIFGVGLWVFRRQERTFADVI